MKKGIVKNLTRVFRRYENPFISLNRRFSLPDKKSDEWINKFNKYQESLLNYKIKHPLQTLDIAYSKFNFLTSEIDWFIDKFTRTEDILDEEIEEKKCYLLNKHKQITSIDYKNRGKVVITLSNNKKIEVWSMTSSIQNVLEEIPDLLNSDRAGKCHPRSIQLSLGLQEDSYVVTGAIWALTPKAQWLHSWVEQEIDGQIYCIDNNLNAVMKKEDYYYLMHPRVIERISKQQLDEDLDIINYLSKVSDEKNNYLKLYCSSRDEAIEKYNKFIDLEDSIDSPQV